MADVASVGQGGGLELPQDHKLSSPPITGVPKGHRAALGSAPVRKPESSCLCVCGNPMSRGGVMKHGDAYSLLPLGVLSPPMDPHHLLKAWCLHSIHFREEALRQAPPGTAHQNPRSC